MNSLAFFIYLAATLGHLHSAADAMTAIACFGFVGTVGLRLLLDQDAYKDARITLARWSKVAVWVFATMLPLSILVPTEKTIVLMAAAEYGEQIAKSTKVAGAADAGLDYLKSWLEESTKRLKDK
jgi:hypothetical protein